MAPTISMLDVSEVLFARTYVYDILRRFFIEEPSKEYLKNFVQQKMFTQFPFEHDSEGIKEGLIDIEEYLKEFDPANNEADFQNLHWDYTRMFIGPFELPSPPWESYYVSKDRLLFQATTMNVRREYQKFGFTASDDHLEADDHIGLELDFMYHLNQQCMTIVHNESVDAMSKVNELLFVQQQFLNEHLLAFVSVFSIRVVTNAETQFYRGLAKVLKHFIQLDSEVLHELLSIDIIH